MKFKIVVMAAGTHIAFSSDFCCLYAKNKESHKQEMTRRSPLRRQRSALDCSSIDEEED